MSDHRTPDSASTRPDQDADALPPDDRVEAGTAAEPASGPGAAEAAEPVEATAEASEPVAAGPPEAGAAETEGAETTSPEAEPVPAGDGGDEADTATPEADAPPAPADAGGDDAETATPEAGSPTTPPVGAAVPPDEEALRIAEALVFASAAPVLPRALSQILPMGMDPDAVIEALRARYAGRGVELVDAAGGVQFRTAQDVAPKLRKVIEVPRRLPRVAMETLAIIAYHQPVTRPEIEEIRGASLSQQTLDALLEANLVVPKGRRESPGRPTLWGTTPQFLTQFGLQDIRDLPRRDDLLVEPPLPTKAPAPPDGDEAPDAGADGAPAGGAEAVGPGADDREADSGG